MNMNINSATTVLSNPLGLSNNSINNSNNPIVSINTNINNNHFRQEVHQGNRTTWEYHTISVTRVAGYGFGIAVSGGRDNPHFANGDPSIAVSDVLKGGPAEDRLQVNDRIISVNSISLENVEYTTAVQVLRDSGNTVTLVVKRRVPFNSTVPNNNACTPHHHSHQHQSSVSGVSSNAGNGNAITTNLCSGNSLHPLLVHQNTADTSINNVGTEMVTRINSQSLKVTLTKSNKKDDFGIVLGCRLFIKEISTKARAQLAANGYSLQKGDVLSRIHNTNCGDTMNLKEAKKIIDGCKERLNLVVLRDINTLQQSANLNQLNNSGNINENTNVIYGSNDNNTSYSNTVGHPTVANCNNNFDDPFLNGVTSYSSQNLYVQPPTRSTSNDLREEKSNLTPRGRSRGPIMEGMILQQLDQPSTPATVASNTVSGLSRVVSGNVGSSGINSTGEDLYNTRQPLYDEETSLSRGRQSSSEPRFISFQKEGSVGIRLTGGNEAGIFVTAVHQGSPASLQGLTSGDKIIKVNDMDMRGVSREEAVLFLLSLQDRIDLIVQYCKKEYNEVIANQIGDSFHIKTHFHCDNPLKGEMPFKACDVFRVIDTLHNGVVGSWKVLKIGRGHQEMQQGVIPNKSRAEELATAQFNATKMNVNESRGNFFRRRRSIHRRSKSLSRENWDDVVFSDSISKFPAYERVILRHPGFVRPVVIFGPLADIAREKLTNDFPDKFASLQIQEDQKTNTKSRIVRLSNIRDVMNCGKHALLDITPNAVDRLNYAQFYPIVIFLKADSKYVIKQLRQALPKHTHKNSKKLLEQSQKLEKIWSHIFNAQILLNHEEAWYPKLRDAIDLQQSGAVWMSESKPVESLSDDFLFPMTTSRLSYASSPESDLELSPGPSTSLSLGNLPQLVKSNSDPSIATNQDNMDRDRNIIGEGMLPPYTIPPYNNNLLANISSHTSNSRPMHGDYITTDNLMPVADASFPSSSQPRHSQYNNSGGRINAPDLPPRIDRQLKPSGSGLEIPFCNNIPDMRFNNSEDIIGRSVSERLFDKSVVDDEAQLEYITCTASSAAATNVVTNPPVDLVSGSGAGKQFSNNSVETTDRHHTSLERQGHLNISTQSKITSSLSSGGNGNNLENSLPPNGIFENVSTYDPYNHSQHTIQGCLGRLGPNAPDDLKSVPNVNTRSLPPVIGFGSTQQQQQLQHQPIPQVPTYGRSVHHDHLQTYGSNDHNDLNRQNGFEKSQYHELNSSRNIDGREPGVISEHYQQRSSNLSIEASDSLRKVETKTDYGKYSNRSNSATQADYGKMTKTSICANGTSYGTSGHIMVTTVPNNHNTSNGVINTENTPNMKSSRGGSFKPVPPPKPKNYRPAQQNNCNSAALKSSQMWDYIESGSPRSSSGFFYPAVGMQHHSQQSSAIYPSTNAGTIAPPPTYGSNERCYTVASFVSNISPANNSINGGSNGNGYNDNLNSSHHYNGGSGTGPYIAPHRGIPPPIGTISSHTPERHGLDLAGSREQRGSAFELYRKPQVAPSRTHHHNISGLEDQPYDRILPQLKSPAKHYKYYHRQEVYEPVCSLNAGCRSYGKNLSPQTSLPYDCKQQHFSFLPNYYYDLSPSNLKHKFEMPLRPHFQLPQELPKNHNNTSNKKKLLLKDSLSAIKNVFLKTTRPLKRMNSLIEPLQRQREYEHHKLKTGLRREHSMLERGVYQPIYSNEYLTYSPLTIYYPHVSPGDKDDYVTQISNRIAPSDTNVFCRTDDNVVNLMDNTYQNLEGENIYNGELNSSVRKRYLFNNLYANRPIIDLERTQIYNERVVMQNGCRQKGIIRRHSTTTADQKQRNNIKFYHDNAKANISAIKNLASKTLVPTSEIMSRRCFSPETAKEQLLEEDSLQVTIPIKQMESTNRKTRRDWQKDYSRQYRHLYETQKDMQEKNFQDKRNVKKELNSRQLEQKKILSDHANSLPAKSDLLLSTLEEDTSSSRKIGVTEELNAKENQSEEYVMLMQSTLNTTDEKKKEKTIVMSKTRENANTDLCMKDNLNISSQTTIPLHQNKIELTADENKLQSSSLKDIQEVEKQDKLKDIETDLVIAESTNIDTMQQPLRINVPFSKIRKYNNTSAESSTINCTSVNEETNWSNEQPNAASTLFNSLSRLSDVKTKAVVNEEFSKIPFEPTTTRGFFDSNGGILHDKDWNVSLYIPPGALAEGVCQEIYFTISDPRLGQAVGSPPLDMENGETMLSPLVMCGPQGLEFLIPVTLNIPHCAGQTSSLGLALKATDSEKQIHTEWDNMDLPSNASAHTVSVKVDHF